MAVVRHPSNAIDLALDATWRFAGLPEAYYRDWLQVAREEARHFALLAEHLATLGHAYGDFDAHDGLWAMCEKTPHDPVATHDRLARHHGAPRLHGPFNVGARLAAGFTQVEMDALLRAQRAGAGKDCGRRVATLCCRSHIGSVVPQADIWKANFGQAAGGMLPIEDRGGCDRFSDADVRRLQRRSQFILNDVDLAEARY
jgi:hypothetical protein